MNSTDSKKIILGFGGFVVFLLACYFVFSFTQNKDGAALSSNQDASAILKPEIVSYLQVIDKESSFLKDGDIMDTNFVKSLQDYSEKIDPLYPQGRDNPFSL